jgi:hypothetical protein
MWKLIIKHFNSFIFVVFATAVNFASSLCLYKRDGPLDIWDEEGMEAKINPPVITVVTNPWHQKPL